MKYDHVLGAGKKSALLISDMQRAFTEGIFDADFRQDKELELIKQLVSVAVSKNIPIIYTVIAYNEYEITHPNRWLQKIPRLKELLEGNTITELDPRLPFNQHRDLLLIKKHTSSFFGTSLANQLYTQGIDTIIMTGCTTSGCVRATTVDGLENGFRMMVVQDAVADRWQDSHKQTLLEINAKYGDVIHSDNAIEIMSQSIRE